jgi:hypothetical protein
MICRSKDKFEKTYFAFPFHSSFSKWILLKQGNSFSLRPERAWGPILIADM